MNTKKQKNITIEKREKLLGKPIGINGGKPMYRIIDVDKIYRINKIDCEPTSNVANSPASNIINIEKAPLNDNKSKP
jgi:hypothetical protein